MIVIDTLQRIREDTGASFSYKCDYETITPLKTFSDAHDVALIVVHHTRKQTEDENPFNQISGTNGLLGAADGAFLLHREKNEVFLEQSVRDMPDQRYVLSLTENAVSGNWFGRNWMRYRSLLNQYWRSSLRLWTVAAGKVLQQS